MIKNASIATLAMFLSAASPAMATSDAHSLYVNLELALNQTTVGTVIRSISEQTGYEFSYDETLLNKKISKVSVNLKNEHIENVLKEVFKLSLIHISEPTRQAEISYAVFCLKKKKKTE